MKEQIPLDPKGVADLPGSRSDSVHYVAAGVAYKRLAIVNIAFLGAPLSGDGNWILVDAGLPGMAGRIVDAATERFGGEGKPAAIVLTHGHFDHVGALKALVERWRVPIYAHLGELPFLDGRTSYPPPDPGVGGGLMAALSPLFPRGPIDVSRWLCMLPDDGAVPGAPGWRWLHTPGHTPGHVSLWRSSDRTLVAGDAFITTNQESAYAVALQKPEMHGPPRYFTPDWHGAEASVKMLANLEPELVVTGHGSAMRGPEMRAALHALADRFEEIAIPSAGRYAAHPA